MNLSPIVLVAALLATPVLAQDAPDLKGTWTGQGSAMAIPEGSGEGEYRLVVSEQNGRLFRGEITYPVNGQPVSEPVVGTVDPDGDRVVFVGDEGHHEAEYDDGVLQDCYVLASKELSVAYCVDLEKQP